MIFTSLKLHNWIAYKDAEITFATDKKKNVTLFRGNNMGGKTTIMRAIRWVLYGDTGDVRIYKKPSDLLNKDSAQNNSFDVSVKLSLKVNGNQVDISRSLKPKKGVNKPSDKDYEESFNVLENGKAIIEDNVKYIETIFDKDISDFFIFDGEKLQEYQKLSNNPKESQKLQETIEKLIRRPFLKSAQLDLKQYAKDLRDKINANTNDLLLQNIYETLEKLADLKALKNGDLTRLKADLKEEEEDLKELKSKRDAFGSKNKDVTRLAEIEGAIPEIKSKIDILKETLKEINKTSWQKIIGMALNSSNQEAHNSFKKFEDISKSEDHLEAKKRFLEESLKDNCYLCGEPLTNEKKKAIQDSINQINLDLGNKDKSSFANSSKFVYQLESYTKNIDIEKLIKINTDLMEQENSLSNLEIEAEDLKIIVGKDKGKIADIQQKIDDATQEIAILKQDIKNIEIEINGPNAIGVPDLYSEIGIEATEETLQDQYDRLLEKTPKSKEKQFLAEVTKLESVFKESIKDLSEQLKHEVELKANKVFKKLIDSNLNYRLEINENFGLIFKSGDDDMETSAAGNLFVALSLISALKDSTGIKGPMMIDTPLARVDLDGREKVLEEFPNMSEQCMILVHSGEVEEKSHLDKILSDRVGKYYEIKKISENESKIISK